MAVNDNEVFPVDENDTDIAVTLELDDGTSLECDILTIFTVSERDYIALIPSEEENEDLDVLVYRYDEEEDGTPILSNIESDEEYEEVSKQFNQLLDDAEDEVE